MYMSSTTRLIFALLWCCNRKGEGVLKADLTIHNNMGYNVFYHLQIEKLNKYKMYICECIFIHVTYVHNK